MPANHHRNNVRPALVHLLEVIASGGGLGGYSRDLDVKQQLLDLEAGVAAGPSLRLAV